jgi:hypothetical protein
MKTTIIAIAAAAVLASSGAQARYLSKGQVCEERAAKETYPVALRGCHGRVTLECKRLIYDWVAAIVLKKRRCIRADGRFEVRTR